MPKPNEITTETDWIEARSGLWGLLVKVKTNDKDKRSVCHFMIETNTTDRNRIQNKDQIEIEARALAETVAKALP
jgi:hypothetical protein